MNMSRVEQCMDCIDRCETPRKIDNMKASSCLLAVMVVVMLFLSFRQEKVQAAPPPPEGWSYRQRITVNHAKVATNLTDFAVLVNFTNANLRSVANGGHVTQSDGGDIRFENYSNVKLNHEIEKYVATNGELIAWVKVDVLSTNVDTVINMYYGSPDTNKQWNVADTWESSLMLVQHLHQTSFTRYDSTSNANNGTPYGGISSNVSGQVDGANSFDGVDDYILCGTNASLNITNVITIEAWVCPTAFATEGYIVSKGNTIGDTVYSLSVGTNGDLKTMRTGGSQRGSAYSIVTNAYSHIAVTISGTSINFYGNGTNIGVAAASGDITTNAKPLQLGWRSGSTYFYGIIDEVRLYNRALSSGEILTQYNNQNSPSAFYGIDAEKYMGALTMITIY